MLTPHDVDSFLDDYYATHTTVHEYQARKNDHRVLLTCVQECSASVILEIGTFQGYTANLLYSFPSVTRVLTVDILDRPGELLPGVEYVDNMAFVPTDVDLVFIDDGHTYEDVVRDYGIALQCHPRCIVFHDADIVAIHTFLRELECSGHHIQWTEGDCLLAYERFDQADN